MTSAVQVSVCTVSTIRTSLQKFLTLSRSCTMVPYLSHSSHIVHVKICNGSREVFFSCISCLFFSKKRQLILEILIEESILPTPCREECVHCFLIKNISSFFVQVVSYDPNSGISRFLNQE